MKNKKFNMFLKRAFDVSVSLTMIVLVSWIYALVFLYHKVILRAHSSLFFIQPRVGRDNQIFRCIKFQTMNNYTRFGETNEDIKKYELFLRKYRIDELPQFFNVLKGDMSIVGPRPLVENEINEYANTIENTRQRHLMKPGMTGLSQITVSEKNGKSEALVFKKINQDVWYCHNWSIMLDMMIFVKTPFFVISQKQIKFSKNVVPQTYNYEYDYSSPYSSSVSATT